MRGLRNLVPVAILFVSQGFTGELKARSFVEEIEEGRP